MRARRARSQGHGGVERGGDLGRFQALGRGIHMHGDPVTSFRQRLRAHPQPDPPTPVRQQPAQLVRPPLEQADHPLRHAARALARRRAGRRRRQRRTIGAPRQAGAHNPAGQGAAPAPQHAREAGLVLLLHEPFRGRAGHPLPAYLPFTRQTAVPWTCGTSSSSVTCHPSVMIMLPTDRPRCAVERKRLTHCLRIPPFNPHGEKRAFGRPEAQNERRNAGASAWVRGRPLSRGAFLGTMRGVLYSRARLPPHPPNPLPLKCRVFGRDERCSAFPCAFAPLPPNPLLPHGEKGEFRRPDG